MKGTEIQSAASLLVTAVGSSLMFKETLWCPLLDPEISAMIDWRKKQAEKEEKSRVSDGFLRLVRLGHRIVAKPR